MNRILIAPARYIQGPGALGDLGAEAARLGRKAFVIGGRRALDETRATIEEGFGRAGAEAVFETFRGECTVGEIHRLGAGARADACDVVIGVGGGKTLDSAKAVAEVCGLPAVVAPTIAASDAPCSALYDIYSEDGVFERSCELPRNPQVVLVDTAVIAKAPTRFLVAGMGDALSTWFEADACDRSSAANLPGGRSTASALHLARLSYEIIVEHGAAAQLACERGIVTEALEQVVEANILISGIGFESSGLAASHALHDGFTILPEARGSCHGERVAFSTLVQMVMENRAAREIEEVLGFCLRVGLPVTLAQIGVVDASEEHLMAAAMFAARPDSIMHNMPFPVDPGMVYRAIVGADAIGRAYRQRCGDWADIPTPDGSA